MNKKLFLFEFWAKIKMVTVIMNIIRIREIREDKNYKQCDIANYLKVTQAQYCRYELGINTIPIEKLDKLATLYNTSIDYLVGRTDISKPYTKRKESKL